MFVWLCAVKCGVDGSSPGARRRRRRGGGGEGEVLFLPASPPPAAQAGWRSLESTARKDGQGPTSSVLLSLVSLKETSRFHQTPSNSPGDEPWRELS